MTANMTFKWIGRVEKIKYFFLFYQVHSAINIILAIIIWEYNQDYPPIRLSNRGQWPQYSFQNYLGNKEKKNIFECQLFENT